MHAHRCGRYSDHAVNWRREPKIMLRSLPDERKALAERYTIDAEEADRRRQLAAEQAERQVEAKAHDAARVEAEEAARQAAEAASRAAADEAAREAAAEDAVRRAAAEEAAREAAAEETAANAAESSFRAAADSARRAAEQEAARRAAEDAAARAPVVRAERQTESEPIEPASPPQPRLMLTPIDEPPAPIEIAENDEREQTVDLPIYRWFGND
jgi:hypothetical protein